MSHSCGDFVLLYIRSHCATNSNFRSVLTICAYLSSVTISCFIAASALWKLLDFPGVAPQFCLVTLVDVIEQIAVHDFLQSHWHSSQLSSYKASHSSLNTGRWQIFLFLFHFNVNHRLHHWLELVTPTSLNAISNDWLIAESLLPTTLVNRPLRYYFI